MSIKNVSTKVTKDNRLNLRCTEAFKVQLKELATQKGLKVTDYVIGLCEYEIHKSNLLKFSSIDTGKKQLNYKQDKEEISEIAKAFKADGLTYLTISEKLNDMGCLTFGLKEWDHNSVAGIFRYNKE
jgi:hypothetical protein